MLSGKEIILMAANLMDVNNSNFETLALQSPLPVLVDFWAPWCGPCKAVAPVLEKMAAAYGDRMCFAKCNVDDNHEISARYGIRSIPTLLFLKNGKVVDKIVGAVPPAKLEQTLKNILSDAETPRAFVVQ
jgi:thioredoxin 1